jgi:phosphoribosyl-AMP cyclohydrolase
VNKIDSDAIANVKYDDKGLVVAIAQDEKSKEVLMVAYMNREALEKTLATGRSWFYSRSRQELWCKGETSGNRQWAHQVYYDCDSDAVLLLVDQEGPACHTGERTCFFRSFYANETEDFSLNT